MPSRCRIRARTGPLHPGVWALLLALWLVPLAGRVHQVAHAAPGQAAAAHGALNDAFASHVPSAATCLLLDQLALGAGLLAVPALAVPLPPAAPALLAAPQGRGVPCPGVFQARAPPGLMLTF